MRKKLMSVFVSVMLAVGLTPLPAFAEAGGLAGAQLSGGELAGVAGIESNLEFADVSDDVLQFGGFVQQAPERVGGGFALGAQSTSDVSGFEAALYKAAESWNGEEDAIDIDVSSYGIASEDVSSKYAAFLNKNGQFYYLSNVIFWTSDSSDNASHVYLRLNTASASNVDDFAAAVDKALSGVEQGWSEEQKALYLHDYLVTHCEYDLTYSKHSAYDALVGGSAVCQGYALAYDYLMECAGVDCDVITSRGINHAWNLVTVDDATYYVDCTWDDPSNIFYEAYCGHKNFLRSKSSFGHTGNSEDSLVTDWRNSLGERVYDNPNVAASDKYDEAYWADVITQIPHVGNLWAYVSGEAASTATVYVHDYASGTNRVLASGIPSKWYVWGQQGGSYWQTCRMSLASNGEAFIASTPTGAVRITAVGDQQTIYELNDTEAALGYVYGLLYNDDAETCVFQLGTYPFGEQPSGSGSFSFAPTLTTSIAGATLKVAPQQYAGKLLTPAVSVILGDGTRVPASGYDVVCTSKCWNVGDYNVVVRGKNGYRGRITGVFKVAPKAVTVAAKAASKKYGAADPELAATVSGLVSGESSQLINYTLTRKPGESVGEYAIQPKGAATQGNYKVKFTSGKFKINPASIKDAKLVLSKTKLTYTGKALKPSVKTVGGKELKAGKDYTIRYSNSKSAKVGSYKVWVEGKGNYAGTSAKATYKIAKLANPVKVRAKAASVSFDKVKKSRQSITAKNAFAVTNNKGGKVTFKKVSGSSKLAVAKGGKVTVTKGAKRGSYKAKVKVSFAAKGSYDVANRVVVITVKVK